jgi:NADPH-dependent 2,4-dienoyl-CoA reductase/sulfur reductase-like enzyme
VEPVDVDVAIVGGGPAGIAAATRAAESGAHVVVIDSGIRPGGQIWRHDTPRDLPRRAHMWITRCQRTSVRWLSLSTVVDVSADRTLSVVGNAEQCSVRATTIVLATGARELFLPFPGWTLPNVMGAGGAQALLKGGLDVHGRRVVVAGSGPLLLPVVAAMHGAGAVIAAVAEQVPLASLIGFATSLWSHPAKIVDAVRYGGRLPARRYHPGTWVARASGQCSVEGVTLTDGRREWVETCDLLCCSYGLIPATELAQLLGCALAGGRVVVDGLQRTTVPGVLCAGEGTGVAGDDAAIVEGEIAGLVAAGRVDEARSRRYRRRQHAGRAFADQLERVFSPRRQVLHLASADTIICRCEDVRFDALDRSWTGRQAKLYTRIGMGSCQGAVCGPAVERIFGWEPGTVRPPLFAPKLESWIDATYDRASAIGGIET